MRAALCWLFSIMFLLSGLGNAASGNPATGITFLSTGILLLPPITAYLERKFDSTATNGGLILIGFLGLFLGSAFSTAKREDQSDSMKTSGFSNNSPEFIKESCLKLSQMFGAQSSYSAIQKEELWKSYKGKAFRWNVEVNEVVRTLLGDGYRAQLKCVNSPSWIVDLHMDFPSSARDLAMGLKKGSVYEITGTLNSYSNLIGFGTDWIPMSTDSVVINSQKPKKRKK